MNTLLERLKPYARAIKYARLYRRALRDAQRADRRAPTGHGPVSFIVACGRSGTTILGRVFEQHPEVEYLFEPYHAWAAIDPRTDMLNLYVNEPDAHCVLEAADVNETIRARFEALIASAASKTGKKHTVEKTPINAMRLGYLDALAPEARYVHIVRDGVDVARSIERLASANTYRIAGRPALNQWWGVNDRKWTFMARDGRARGLFADEIDRIDSHAQRGAYEWLLSLHEVERHRESLGGRLFELTYENLTGEPHATLGAMCEHLGIARDDSWLDDAAARISDARRNPGPPLLLPPRMAGAFNEFQERFGFAGRAASAQAAPAAEPREEVVR